MSLRYQPFAGEVSSGQAELTQTMYELTFRLPNTPDDRRQLLALGPEQSQLYNLFR